MYQGPVHSVKRTDMPRVDGCPSVNMATLLASIHCAFAQHDTDDAEGFRW